MPRTLGYLDTVMTPKISILVPTRERPDRFKTMLDSLFNTVKNKDDVEILFCVDMDDTEITKYAPFKSDKVHMYVMEPQVISKSWNIIAKEAKGDILVMGNDDQVYVTPNWDAVLLREAAKYPDKIYCLWFNDNINGAKHCAFPMISRRWYETLGYFVPELFLFHYNDTWVYDIAKRIERAKYLGHVTVEHWHYGRDHSLYDKTYNKHRKEPEKDKVVFEKTEDVRKAEAAKLRKIMR